MGIFNHVEMASNIKLSLKSVISASRISLPSDHFLPKQTWAIIFHGICAQDRVMNGRKTTDHKDVKDCKETGN